MEDADNVTKFTNPTFAGTGDIGGAVSLFADGQLIGSGTVGGDASDGVEGDGLGGWEITSGTLDDGIYLVAAVIENENGSVSSEQITIEIDTLQPNTPLLDLIPSSDTGESQTDNITSELNPTFNMATIDPNQDAHLSEFNYKYRVFVRLDSGVEELVYDSVTDDSFPNSATDGVFTRLENLRRTITRAVPDGTHNFKLEVEDRAGNISEDFLLNVTVDTSLLTAADGVTLDLLDPVDTGMDGRDNVTKINEPSFGGIAEVGAKVSLFADGVLVGTAIVGSDETDFVADDGLGSWEITSQPLADGQHEMIVHIEDAAGNFERSNSLTIDVDTVAPNTPFLDLVGGTLVSEGLETTTSNSLTFNMTTEDPASDDRASAFNLKYRIFLRPEGGEETLVYESVVDPEILAGNLSGGFTDLEFLQTVIEDLPNGDHNFKLEVEDRAGNISDDYLLTVSIQDPVVIEEPTGEVVAVTIDLISASDAGLLDVDNVTNINRPTFNGVGTVGAEVRLINGDGDIIGTAIVGGDASNGILDDGLGRWEIVTRPLDDGIYVVFAELEDDFGNTATTETITLEVDTLAPNTPFLDLIPRDDTGLANDDNVTSQLLPTFHMATLDPNQDAHINEFNYIYRLFVRLDSGVERLVYDSVADGGFPASAVEDGFINLENLRREIDLGVPDGVHNFKLEVEDRAGNISQDYILDVAIDTVLDAPNGVVGLDLVTSSDTGMNERDNVTKIDTPVFSGVAEVGATVTIFANGVPVGTATVGSDETDFVPGDGLGVWEVTVTPLDDGIYEVLAHVEDLAGNFLRSNSLTVEVDTVEPNTPFLDLLNDTGASDSDNLTSDSSLNFNFTTEDPAPAGGHNSEFNLKYRIFLRAENGTETLVYNSVTDTNIDASEILEGFTNLEQLQATLGPFPDGVHNFKLEVEDRAGNISHDFLLDVEIDSTLDGDPTIDLIASSDSGMFDDDNVTGIDQPAFTGLGEVGSTVLLRANGVIVGTGVVQSDDSDGVPGDGLGEWEITSEPLDDGIYEITAGVQDSAGNFEETGSLTIEVDTLQPNTPYLDVLPTSDTGISQNDNETFTVIPTLHMATIDPNQDDHLSEFNYKYRLFVRHDSGVELLLYESATDGDSFTRSSFQDGFTNLENLRRAIELGVPDGTHNFKLEVEDRAGNISEDFLLNVTIDTVLEAPGGLIGIDLINSSDTGMSERDSVTKINDPTFSGVAEVGATVTIFANGQVVGTGVVGSDETDFVPGDGLGVWEVTVEPLDDGVYEVLAHVEDVAGNFLRSQSLAVEIDTTQPNTPYLDLLNDTGHSNHDDITLSDTLDFNFTTEDPSPAGGHLLDTNYKYRIYVRPEGGTETLVYNSVVDTDIDQANILEGFTNLEQLQATLGPFPDGIHNFKLEVEDRAGNISEDFLLTVQIDTELAGDPTIDLVSSSDSGMSDIDNVTGIQRPAFTGVAEMGSAVRLRANGVLIGETEIQSDASDGVLGDGLGEWEITAEPLDDGIYEITAEVEDWAGNVEVTEVLNIEVDTRAPNTPFLDLVSTADTGILLGDEVTSDNTLTFNMTTTDESPEGHLIAENYKFRLYLRPENGPEVLVYDSATDGELPPEAFVDGLIDINFLTRTLGELPDGEHNFKLEVEDRAGNISEDFLLNVTIDTTLVAPTIDLVSFSDSGMSDLDNVTRIDAPTFVGTGDVGDRVTLFANGVIVGTGFVGSDETDFVSGDGRGAWSITIDPLDDGIYDVLAHIEDDAGNFQRTEPVQIEIDTLEPNTPHLDLVTSSDTGHSNHDNITGDNTPTFTFTTEDPNGDAHLNAANFKYRLYVRPEGGQEMLVYNSVGDPEIDQAFLDGSFTSLEFLERTLDELPDGIHNFKLEVEDRAGNISHDVTMTVEIDSTLPVNGQIDMTNASDSGMSSTDNVTNKDRPAFTGIGAPGTQVRLFANGQFVGTTEVGSDESDGIIGNGFGIWEIVSDTLADNVYTITATFEDWAGNFSGSNSLQIEVDTLEPNTPFLDLLEPLDSGRNDDDNITNAPTLNFSATTEDPNADNHTQLFPDGHNFKYRIFVRPESGEETLVYDSVTDDNIPDKVDGFTSLQQVFAAVDGLPEGLHNFKLEVEDRAGNISHDFLQNLLIDRTAFEGTCELHPVGDTGIWGIDSTFGDGITGSSSPPVFTGTAEANNLVTLLIDGEIAGSTVVGPFDGDDALQNASWVIESSVALTGGETIEIVYTDPAGNSVTANCGDDAGIVVDTIGLRIENITRNDPFLTSVFDPKPAGGPDPLIDSIVVHFSDAPERDQILYDAVLHELALEEGNYRLVGDANGNIPITSVEILGNNPGPGMPTTAVQLNFGVSLPDDRYTFTVFDRIADAAGNPLDGDSGAAGPFEGNAGLTSTAPIFPTGDGNHGGDFVARFTVDSRPELGVWSAGSVHVDTNGNFLFDPTNTDYVNRDITYNVGFTSDDIFAGNFAGLNGAADGYDKLAAYGRFGGWMDGTFRWWIDLDNDGVPDIDVEDPSDVNGLPIAGNFDGVDINGDEVGLYTGNTWHLDTDGDFLVDFELQSELIGYPIVGDFDNDGHDDLATWADDMYMVDLANGTARGWDGVADAMFRFGFIGVRERPIVADMDQDGYDDFGLWVPDRGAATPREAGEWYWLVSGGNSVLDRITDSLDPVQGKTQEILFRPVPFGNDIFAQFGDEFAIPIVGNFDPPTLPTASAVTQIYTNPIDPLDVNNDGSVTPRDVLITINHLNRHGSTTTDELTGDEPFLDTNQDDFVSSLDVLRIINHLNREEEKDSDSVDQVDVIAEDVAQAVFGTNLVVDADDEEDE